MNSWLLESRQQPEHDIDASAISLFAFEQISDVDQVKSLSLRCGDGTRPLGELFSVSKQAGDSELRIVGDLTRFHRLGMNQRSGRLIVEGSVGNYAGAMMSGGEIWIAGDAGDYLASPVDACRTGMSGGRIVVGGSVGDYTGHRMRRGQVFVEGSAGDFVASHQVAGTIVIGAEIGEHTGYAMRRGTLMVNCPSTMAPTRFSEPIEANSTFFALLAAQTACWVTQAASIPFACKAVSQLVEKIAKQGYQTIRGDFAVGGQGEIIFPR
ncbi:formylmethanofuran dehydrogenase subunit C [Novipirellula sp. SH528]|uniref:formylmethanofuran dehydrogenase subunit C n=1 Tax=Novipirellula sp. SH528 TaxID=3454466 RepID=UPI003FA00ED7